MLTDGDWSQLAKELHRPILRKFPKRRVIITRGVDDTWSADLIDMGKLSKWNKGYKYILTVIDVFSRYAWGIPLKNKYGKTVKDAFKRVGNKPKYLWTDKGTEFYNKYMREYLDKKGIKLYSTENEEKGSIIERFNRTLKKKIYEDFTRRGNTVWIN